MRNFNLVNCDTDSIMVCKPDGSEFSLEEQKNLLIELNEQFPERISWEPDGTFRNVIVIKAKNYVLRDELGKVIIKGSALKASLKEPALKEFINEIIYTILNEKYDYVNIYTKYVKEINNLQDIKRWASKKTLTNTTETSRRSNETKIIAALKGTEYTSGDKFHTYFTEDGSVKLVEHHNNDHSKDRLLKKLYETSMTFETIIPKETFVNYSLKRSKVKLDELVKT